MELATGGGADDVVDASAERFERERLLFAHADSDSDREDSTEEMATNSPCQGCRQQQQQQHQPGNPALPHRSASQGQRLRVCQELVGTERKYCCCLRIIIDLLAESIKAAACVSVKDLSLIFPKSLPKLRELHSDFLSLIEERLCTEAAAAVVAAATASAEAAHPAPSFSAAVLEFLESNEGELFRLYRDYVNDFGCAVRALRKCQQRSARLRRLLHCLQRHPSCEGLDLTAFLLTPVQRTPRYLLLMCQLQAHTPPGHSDLPSLTSALARLRGLLDGLNVSIHSALRQAAPTQQLLLQPPQLHQKQHQKQQRKKPQGGRPHGSASCESLQLLGRLVCRRSSCDVGGGSVAPVVIGAPSAHHLLGVRRRVTQPELIIYSCGAGAASARCRSVPPPKLRASKSPAAPVASTVAVRDPSPTRGLMGPRSRAISRQLRTGDRCHSAGDILRPSQRRGRQSVVGGDGGGGGDPANLPLHPAPLATGDEEPHHGGTARRRAQSTSRSGTLKESLRKMFLPRRKSLTSDVDSLATSDSRTDSKCPSS